MMVSHWLFNSFTNSSYIIILSKSLTWIYIDWHDFVEKIDLNLFVRQPEHSVSEITGMIKAIDDNLYLQTLLDEEL